MRYAYIVDGVVVQTGVNQQEGMVEIPDDVWPGYRQLEDGTFAPPPPPPINPSEIDYERDRRFGLGFDFQGHHFQTALPSDRDNFLGACDFAGLAITLEGSQPGDLRWADPDSDFYWIDANSERVYMDAYTVIGLCKAAFSYKVRLVQIAETIKQMDPIPREFRSDEYWTVNG